MPEAEMTGGAFALVEVQLPQRLLPTGGQLAAYGC